ncbi:hypothetical protein [Pantoea alhagi]|nr:hypothetical protein [Pantoea alhagi]
MHPPHRLSVASCLSYVCDALLCLLSLLRLLLRLRLPADRF